MNKTNLKALFAKYMGEDTQLYFNSGKHAL